MTEVREAPIDLTALVDNPFDSRRFCDSCPYAGHKALATTVNPQAEIMVVGEAPAREEMLAERNFVGSSGRLLTRYLREIGHHRREINISNIIRCQIPGGLDRPKKDSTIKELSGFCGQYVLWEILRYAPKIVILLGKPAIHYFVQGSPSVTSIRGKVFYSRLAKTHIMCTYHPAAVMRDWSYEKLIISDLRKAFEFAEHPSASVKPTKYKIARGLEESLNLCEYLQSQDEIVFDVETDDLSWQKGDVLSWGFSSKPFTGITIPFRSIHSTPLTKKERIKFISQGLKPLLESSNKKIGHNIAFDCHWALNYDIHVNNISFDTMLAHHLIDENLPLNLDLLADLYTDIGLYAKELYAYLPNKKTSYNVIPDEVLWKYGCQDCDAEFRLKEIFDAKLDKEGVRWLFENITVPLIDAIVHIERYGVKVDVDGFAQADEKAKKELETLRKEMASYTGMGESFNPNSSHQIQKILFDILQLPKGRKTKTGYSTDAKVLESLEGRHEFVDLLMRYRKVAKFKGTYLDGTKEGKQSGLMRQIDSNGRIHTEYKIHGTATGRLSSSSPNLQNIPRGDTFRPLFIAPKGYKLVIADFERGELYTAAYLSRDSQLKRALQKDVHRIFAAKMYAKKPEDVTKEDRIKAKMVIFGILYGRGPDSIAVQLKISRQEALKYIIQFFDSYPQLEAWVKRQHAQVRRYGFVRNLYGRKRHLYGIFSVQDGYQKGMILRQAQNTPVQGSLAYAGHLAFIELDKKLREAKLDAHPVLLIHDEVVVEAREDLVPKVSGLLKECFEKPHKGLRVPIDIYVGDNWGAK